MLRRYDDLDVRGSRKQQKSVERSCMIPILENDDAEHLAVGRK